VVFTHVYALYFLFQGSEVMVFDMHEGSSSCGSGGGGSSLQDAFAVRKKSGLSDEELNKRHRRTAKRAVKTGAQGPSLTC